MLYELITFHLYSLIFGIQKKHSSQVYRLSKIEQPQIEIQYLRKEKSYIEISVEAK
jgi:hypothetical protein